MLSDIKQLYNPELPHLAFPMALRDFMPTQYELPDPVKQELGKQFTRKKYQKILEKEVYTDQDLSVLYGLVFIIYQAALDYESRITLPNALDKILDQNRQAVLAACFQAIYELYNQNIEASFNKFFNQIIDDHIKNRLFSTAQSSQFTPVAYFHELEELFKTAVLKLKEEFKNKGWATPSDNELHNLVVDRFLDTCVDNPSISKHIQYKYKRANQPLSFGKKAAFYAGNFLSFFTASSSSFLMFLAIVVLLSGPFGWAAAVGVGIVGGTIALGMNSFLMYTSMRNADQLSAANTGSTWDSFLFGMTAFFTAVTVGSTFVMQLKSVTEQLHGKLGIVGDVIAGVVIALAGVYFFLKMVGYLLPKRFAKQIANLGRWAKRKLGGYPKLEIELLEEEASVLEKSEFEFAAIHAIATDEISNFFEKLNKAALADQDKDAITLSDEKIKRAYEILNHPREYSKTIVMQAAEAVIQHAYAARVKELKEQFEAQKSSGDQQSSGSEKECFLSVNRLAIYNDIVKGFAQHYSHLDPAVIVFVQAKKKPDTELVGFMQSAIKKFHESRSGDRPLDIPAMREFFDQMLPIWLSHYERMEETNPNFKRPRKIEIYNEVVDTFALTCVNDSEQGKQLQLHCKKKILTDVEIRNSIKWGKRKAIFASIVGSLLPVVGLLLLPPPFGFIAAGIYLAASIYVDYRMLQESNNTKLAITIDEDLELGSASKAVEHASYISVGLYAIGNAVGRYTATYTLASQALKIPKIGLIIAGVILGVSSLAKSIVVAGNFIKNFFSKRFKKNKQADTAEEDSEDDNEKSELRFVPTDRIVIASLTQKDTHDTQVNNVTQEAKKKSKDESTMFSKAAVTRTQRVMTEPMPVTKEVEMSLLRNRRSTVDVAKNEDLFGPKKPKKGTR